MKKFVRTLAVSAIWVLLAVSLCPAAEETIKIGVTAPLTGNFAEYGQDMKNANTLAVDEINAKGGVLGKKVELIIMDSKSDPKEAALIAQKFTADKSIVAQVGDFSSTACFAAAPVYERAKMVQLAPTSSHPEFTKQGEYMFTISGLQNSRTPFIVEHVLRDYLHKKKVALIYPNNDFGLAVQREFGPACEKFGLEIVGEAYFQERERDFTTLINKLRQSEPEAIYLAAMYNEAGPIARQIRRAGWDVPLVGCSAAFSNKLIELGGDAVEGLLLDTLYTDIDPIPVVQDFVKVYSERYGKRPNFVAAQNYDAIRMIFEAITRANSTDRTAIRDQLLKIKDFDGVTGIFHFEPDRTVARKYLILGIEKGQWVVKADKRR
ncbi:MAG: ABC transporter substrate-binding protein [Synergistaceae bacterium]|nr:ABC transporter substrate-binding protein [Synergistaceae bacterium]